MRVRNRDTQLFILAWSSAPDYTSIVPRSVHIDATPQEFSGSTGVSPLDSGSPPAFHPFMVHRSDLHAAITRWLDAARGGGCYENPTTGVRMPGCRLRLTKSPLITPQDQRHGVSVQAIRYLWEQIDLLEMEVEFHLNPVAPLIADFLLEIPKAPEPLRIEHKASRTKEYTTPEHARNPFAASRQWHFLVWQPLPDQLDLYCIGRHAVPKEWGREFLALDLSAFRYTGPSGLRSMIENMRDEAPRAIGRADEIRDAFDPGVLLMSAKRLRPETRPRRMPSRTTSLLVFFGSTILSSSSAGTTALWCCWPWTPGILSAISWWSSTRGPIKTKRLSTITDRCHSTHSRSKSGIAVASYYGSAICTRRRSW